MDCSQNSAESATEIYVEAGGENVNYGYSGEMLLMEDDMKPDVYVTFLNHATSEVVDSVGLIYASDITHQAYRNN